MEDHSTLVKEHFEIKYSEYDKLIIKLIPHYKQMHEVIVKNFKADKKRLMKILDLGIGTGYTSLKLLEKLPDSMIEGVDISPNMLNQARIRLKKYLHNIKLIELDIKEIELKEKYDFCVGVLSIHHLNKKEKQKLFKKVFNNLNKDGIFIIGDIIKFDSKEETKNKENEWKEFLISGLGKKQGQYWFDNYKEEDLPDSVSNQIGWLSQAGFKEVKCLWQKMNYAVIFAKK